MTRAEEVDIKLERVRGLMSERGLAGVLLGTQANFAWVTGGGDNHVGLSSEGGVAAVLVTPHERFLITTNIEGARLADEEVAGLGLELHVEPWHEARPSETLRQLAGQGPVAADHSLAGTQDMSAEIARLRWQLLEPEVERYRWVGRAVGLVLEEVAREVSPGMSEVAAAGLMVGKCFSRGLLPNVCLVAADERALQYRHPVPTDQRVNRHLMLVIGARRWGLAVSATRAVHFGSAPAELREKHRAVCTVDACFILGSRPGTKVAELFRTACDEYRRQGFPEEWKLHHQGGATGYAPREYKAVPDSQETVMDSQAFAWNPSIAGTKSEDTTLASEAGPQVLSPSENWPMVPVSHQGETIERPDILQR